MPIWKCDSFEKKESSTFYWNYKLINCGLCKHWLGNKCEFHETIIDYCSFERLGENAECDEEEDIDYGFSRVNTEWDEWGGYGKPS